MNTVPFCDIAEFINGRAFKPSEWNTEGLPIVRIQNLTGSSQAVNYYDGDVDEKHLIKRGDILISWSASLGVFMWNSENAVLNQHIFKAVTNGKVDRKFFYFAATNALEEMRLRVHG